MQRDLEHRKTAELLAEAEDLIRKINSDALQYMQDDHRLAFEKHVEKLKKIKSSAQVQTKAKNEANISDSAEGMHAAIQDIVKAMQQLTHHLT
jgi:hypothetical protein